MADPRFFDRAGPFPLGVVAELADATLGANADPGHEITDVAPLQSAGPRDVSFFDNRRYADSLGVSGAGACLIRPSDTGKAPPGMALLVTETPYLSFARVSRAFYPVPAVEPGIAPTAAIDPTAAIGPDCRIDHFAVIEANVSIGARCHVGPQAVIGKAVSIGEDSRIGAGCSLGHCIVGSRVRLFAGVRIGEDGFGFATERESGTHVDIPQIGRVVIEDDVAVGANSTIDRGAGPDTVIGQGTRIDNLVQIGHNVVLGRGCIIVAQAGVAGSAELGDFAALAAQSGVAGHIKVGVGGRVAAMSGAMRDVADGETVAGAPAMPIKQFFRGIASLKRLSERE